MGGRRACSQRVNQSKSGTAAGPGAEVTPEHVWSALGVRQLIPTGHAIFAGSFRRADCGLFTLPSQTLMVEGMHGDHQHGKNQWRSSSAF